MNNILSYYTKYTAHLDDYNKWNDKTEQNAEKQKAESILKSCDANNLKAKAKAMAEPLLVADNFEHEKAEDSETFFQTYNIELMSVVTALSSLPVAITKTIPLLTKHADKSNFAKNAAGLLNKYKNLSIKAGGINLAVPKLLSAAVAIASSALYISGMKKSMDSQLGLIRKASFDSTQEIINDPKMFAILTPEQEQKLETAVSEEEKRGSFVDKLKDKADIKSSFKSVSEYKKNYSKYIKQKEDYKKSLEQTGQKPSDKQLKEAEINKQLHQNMLKNVEFNSLEKLRKIETVSNISYSALFTGGFLEYLITDKLVDVFHIKNKPLQGLIKLGVPLLTYFLLNKNISDIENKAILATKYKNLKNFVENPAEYKADDGETSKGVKNFVKSTLQDMREYDKFAQDELPKIKEKLEAKKSLELSPSQEREAKILQRNTSMVLNEHRENVYEQSVGVKSFSETILGPVDILATAVGGFLGTKIANTVFKGAESNKKLKGICQGLGAVLTFIPAAILEAKLTKKQKLSEKVGTSICINNLKNAEKFIDYSVPAANDEFSELNLQNCSEFFKDFH